MGLGDLNPVLSAMTVEDGKAGGNTDGRTFEPVILIEGIAQLVELWLVIKFEIGIQCGQALCTNWIDFNLFWLHELAIEF